jgi:predicted ABC-type ATPase
MKELIIVGGPNGCGKTTFSLKYAAMSGLKYLSADSIAAALNPKDPAAVAVTAGRMFSAQLSEILDTGQSAIVETTLSGFRCGDRYNARQTAVIA